MRDMLSMWPIAGDRAPVFSPMRCRCLRSRQVAKNGVAAKSMTYMEGRKVYGVGGHMESYSVETFVKYVCATAECTSLVGEIQNR